VDEPCKRGFHEIVEGVPGGYLGRPNSLRDDAEELVPKIPRTRLQVRTLQTRGPCEVDVEPGGGSLGGHSSTDHLGVRRKTVIYVRDLQFQSERNPP
jgi:hypothetical protein